MKLNLIKNISIIVLVILCLFQMNQLLFGTASGRGFFSFLPVKKTVPNPEYAHSRLVTPYRIITGLAPNKYTIIYNDLHSSSVKIMLDEVIGGLFSSGEFVKAGSDGWNYFLSSPSFIYEYKFSMPSGTFANFWAVRPVLLTSRTPSFDAIIFIPNETSETLVTIVFINNDGMYFEFRIQDSSINQELNTALAKAHQQDYDLYYVSSKQSGYGISGNTFIAATDDLGFLYDNVLNINPYMIDGSILLSSVERQIDIFFDYPERKWVSTTQNSFNYTDDTTVVRYNANRLLEYLNYQKPERGDGAFESAFALAIDFIERDPSVRNEFYLADYSNDGAVWSFCFDFVINDFPLLLSNSQRAESNCGMNHAMEITINDGTVAGYKRFVAYYENATSRSGAVINFDNTADSLFLFAPDDNDAVLNIYLAYKIEDDNMLYLHWFIETEDSVFVTPVR